MVSDISYKLLGFNKKEEFDFPNIINIEIFRGDCYCRCVHCPVGITKPEKRSEVFGFKKIDFELYKRIIKQISKHSHSTVRMHSVGEPLMWDDLILALRFNRSLGVRTWIFTCAVTDDKDKLETICENAEVVEVSVNSINQKDYEEAKGIKAFDLVCSNIQRVSNYIENRNLATRLLVSRVESNDRIADSAFVAYWKSSGLVSDAFVRSYHTYNDMIPDLMKGDKRIHKPCLVHWGRFNISVDGYAVVCFNELFKKTVNPLLVLGDLRKQSISEIWQGSKLNAIRRAEMSGDYSELVCKDVLPCQYCFSCQPMDGNRQTSEYQIRKFNNPNA